MARKLVRMSKFVEPTHLSQGGGGSGPGRRDTYTLSPSCRRGADADRSRPAAHVQHHRIFAELKILPDECMYGGVGGEETGGISSDAGGGRRHERGHEVRISVFLKSCLVLSAID